LTRSPRGAVLDMVPARYRSIPPAPTSAGEDAVELAATAGLILDPWQEDVLVGAQGERPDRRWASPEVGLIVARQNGKGSILEARQLAGLFIFEEPVQLYSAHEMKTTTNAMRRVLGLIEGTPDLSRKVKRVLQNNVEMSIELRGGPRMQFVARTGGSGRGFTVDTLYLDEAYRLTAAMLSALLPTQAAVPNPQTWYTSSAPLPILESETLRRLCRRGRAGGDPRLAYFEWSADPEVSLDDRAAWYAANPGLGIRLEEETLATFRAAMEPEDFAREHLTIWHEDETAEPVIPAHDWTATRYAGAELEGWMLAPVTLAVDMTPDRSWASIGVAGACRDGGIALEVADHGAGAGWVLDRVDQMYHEHGARAIVIDTRSAAATMIDTLKGRGVTVLEASTADHVKAAGDLYDAIVAHEVRHLGTPELDAAAIGATQRTVGDAWLWDRRAGVVITPLVAVTLARWGHLQPVEAPPPPADFFTI